MRVLPFVVVCVLASVCGAADSKGSKPKSSKGELLALVDPLEVSSAQCSSAPVNIISRSFAGDGAVLGVAPLASAGVLADDWSCSAKCNRKPFDSNETDSSCWGTFTWFCKSSNASRHTVMGVKCEGHYSLYTDKDAGKAVAVCEGLHKYFNVRSATCPATGARATKFMSAGCFGTGASKMSDESSARGAAAAVVADMGAYVSGATAAPFVSGDVGVVLAGQANSVDGQLSAGHHTLMGIQGVGRVESGRGFAYEGKCGGLGWEVKGVTTSTSTDSAEPVYSDVEELEAAVDSSLAALGLPSKLLSVGAAAPAKDGKAHQDDGDDDDDAKKVADPKAKSKQPSLEPPDNSLLKALLPAVAAKVDLGDGRHLTCNLTCNGEEPWLDGALPCWGKLLLRCEGRPNAQEDFSHKLTKLEAKEAEAAAREAKWVKEKKKKTAAAAKKKKDELRKKEAKEAKNTGAATASDLPLSRTAYAAVHGRRAMVSRRQRRALLAAVQRYTFAAGLDRTELTASGASFEFDATCKGFWTGWFGKRCYGLTETHGAFTSDVKDVEVWGLCTGKHGVSAKKGKEGYAMGAWCKGHSAKGVIVEWKGQPEEPHVQDLHLDMQDSKALLPSDDMQDSKALLPSDGQLAAAAGIVADASVSTSQDTSVAVSGEGMAVAGAEVAAVAGSVAGSSSLPEAAVVAEGGVVEDVGAAGERAADVVAEGSDEGPR